MNEIKISNCYEINYNYKISLFVIHVAKVHISLDCLGNKFRDKQIVVEWQEEFLNFVAWLEIDFVVHISTCVLLSDIPAEDFWRGQRI